MKTMKKITSFTLALSMLLSCSTMTAFADDTPVNIEAALYDQLIGNGTYDTNEDGIISEDEFKQINYLNLDLADITSLDFLNELPGLRSLYLRNGSFSDFSFLKGFTSLSTLQLSNMPQVTDVSFIKDMNLDKCYLSGMDQITDEQRLELLRFQDAENGAVGFSNMIGALPQGLFVYSDISLAIENTDIACFDRAGVNPLQQSAAEIYGIANGSTTYSFSFKGEVIHTGTINIGTVTEYVTPSKANQELPGIYTSRVLRPGNTIVLHDGNLCAFENGSYSILRKNVKGFSDGSFYDDSGSVLSVSADLVLYQDGTLEINEQTPVGADGVVFSQVHDSYAISESGDVYCTYGENGKLVLDKVYNGFSGFPENDLMYIISDTGEVVLLELKKQTGKATTRQAFPTGIMNITGSYGDYFIDADHILWEVDRNVGSEPTIRKTAEDVIWVGFRSYGGGAGACGVYITSDGTAYSLSGKRKLILDDESENAKPYLASGTFTYSVGGGDYALAGNGSGKYHIDSKNNLCMEYNGVRKLTNDAAQYLTYDMDTATDLPNVYYLKLDNTIWCYSFAEDAFKAISEADPKELVKGDINADGELNVSDVVLLQKWLLAVPDTHLPDWKAGNFCDDDRLDVFDLCLMKRELLNNANNQNG